MFLYVYTFFDLIIPLNYISATGRSQPGTSPKVRSPPGASATGRGQPDTSATGRGQPCRYISNRKGSATG